MVDQEKVINKLTHLQDEKKKLERILSEQEMEKGKSTKVIQMLKRNVEDNERKLQDVV